MPIIKYGFLLLFELGYCRANSQSTHLQSICTGITRHIGILRHYNRFSRYFISLIVWIVMLRHVHLVRSALRFHYSTLYVYSSYLCPVILLEKKIHSERTRNMKRNGSTKPPLSVHSSWYTKGWKSTFW